MATISKVPVSLTGFLGGPGVNTFYVLGTVAGDELAPLHDFYTALVGAFPDEVTISVPSSGVTVESTTGELVGGWAADVHAPISGTNTGVYASGVGCVVRWVTATVFKGRLLRGRTFLVPLGGDQFENNGLLTTATQGFIDGTADTLVTAMAAALVVWHRPSSGNTDPADDLGAAIPVLGPFVPRTPAILRSRRD